MILGVVGMQVEARLLSRAGLPSVVGGGNAERLERQIAEALISPPLEGWTGLLSFGVAGGLASDVRAGDLVIATAAIGPDGETRPADPAWAAALSAALPHARVGALAGVAAPVVTAEAKAALFAATGALAVDMESHVAAQVAGRYRLPFAAVRAISDPVGRTLPAAAVAGFGGEGEADIAAVLAALARDPRQLPALIRTGVEAGRAFRALREAVAALARAGQLGG